MARQTESKSPFFIPFKDLIVLLIAGFFLLMLGNGQFTLFDNSEPHYTRVAQEMVQTGDYINIHFNGDYWYVHPPIYFWMLSAWASVFGWTEFNFRFFESLFGIFGLLVTYWISAYFYDRKTARFSAAILGTSLYYIVMSRLAIFDTLLNTALLLSCFLFLLTYYEKNNSRYYIAWALSTTFAVLTKGPIGLVHQALVIGPFLVWKRDLAYLWRPKSIAAIIGAIALCAPWYSHQLITHGKPFFDMALKDYTWYRFFGVVENQSGPWYFYFPILLLFYPWALYIPLCIQSAIQSKPWKSRHILTDFQIFSWMMIVITFAFFSLAGTKLPNYIMAIFPFLAILIGTELSKPTLSKHAKIASIAIIAAGASTIVIALNIQLPDQFETQRHILLLVALIPFATSIVYTLWILKNKPNHAVAAFTVGTAVWSLFLCYSVFPRYEAYKDPKLVVDVLKERPTPYSLINYHAFSPYMMVYLNRNIPYIEGAKNLKINIQNATAPTYIVTTNAKLKEITQIHPNHEILLKRPSKVLIKLH